MVDVEMWLSSQAADFFTTGVQELIPRYKHLISGDDYIEEVACVCTYFLYIIILFFSLIVLLTALVFKFKSNLLQRDSLN
jgi:hypothetical protein